MAKRMVLMLIVSGIVISGLGFAKYQQIQAAVAQGASFQPPPEAVTTVEARAEQWPSTLSAIGTAAPVQGVVVSADLPGIVARIAFESGAWVNAGDVLVELDTKQEQAQLAAAEAERNLARVNLARREGLVAQGAISGADYDRAAAEQKLTEARVAEIRATISRKMIRAPFSGVLGLRQVNLGQYLTGGDPVAPLQAFDPIYVNFGVPQQDAGKVRIGGVVHISARDLPGAEFTGRITAMNAVVDEATRNVQVQATLSNAARKLRPGMFVQTELRIGGSRAVTVIPASAISYAPYGDSVFVVSELEGPDGRKYQGVRQQFVKVEGARGDQVAVVSGVNAGQHVVTSGLFKLRNGAAIQVNNKTMPGNNPQPKPEDN